MKDLEDISKDVYTSLEKKRLGYLKEQKKKQILENAKKAKEAKNTKKLLDRFEKKKNQQIKKLINCFNKGLNNKIVEIIKHNLSFQSGTLQFENKSYAIDFTYRMPANKADINADFIKETLRQYFEKHPFLKIFKNNYNGHDFYPSAQNNLRHINNKKFRKFLELKNIILGQESYLVSIQIPIHAKLINQMAENGKTQFEKDGLKSFVSPNLPEKKIRVL